MLIIRSDVFRGRYDIEPVAGLSSGDPNVLYFPGAVDWSAWGGEVLRVHPTGGDAWTGVFQQGFAGPRGESGVWFGPGDESFLIVTEGAGYLVHAASPRRTSELPSAPIIWVAVFPELDTTLLLSDFDATAVGEDGLRWRTQRLALDGFSDIRAHGPIVHALASTHDGEVPVSIDARSGEAIGGCRLFD